MKKLNYLYIKLLCFICIVLIIGWLVACDRSEHGAVPVSSEPLLTARPTAPEIQADRWIGPKKTLAQAKADGKAVLIDFWGQWCPPCRAALPHTQSTWEKYRDKGLVVVGVHSDYKNEPAENYVTQKGFTFTTAVDTGATANTYGVEGWPTFYLIDKEGNIAWGPSHAPPADVLIESLL